MSFVPTTLALETINYPTGDILLKATLVPAIANRPIGIYYFNGASWVLVATVSTTGDGTVTLPFYVNKQVLWPAVSLPALLQAEHIGDANYGGSTSNVVKAGSGESIPWMWIAVGVGAVAVIGLVYYTTRRK